MSKTKSKNNPVDDLIKKAKNTLGSKPKTRLQSNLTHDSELASSTLNKGNSMEIDAPDMGDCHQEFYGDPTDFEYHSSGYLMKKPNKNRKNTKSSISCFS